METKKICPFRLVGDRSDASFSCWGESCAWYIEGQRRCAMAVLAESADRASDHIEDIALKD